MVALCQESPHDNGKEPDVTFFFRHWRENSLYVASAGPQHPDFGRFRGPAHGLLCLLLLTWSIAGVDCRACHSSGTFFIVTHTHTHTRIHTHTLSFSLSLSLSHTHTHTHTHTHLHTHIHAYTQTHARTYSGQSSSDLTVSFMGTSNY